MLAEFPKAIDYNLKGFINTFCFVDNIIIVCKGSQEDHFKKVTDCLQKLDADDLLINLSKGHFVKPETLCLG